MNLRLPWRAQFDPHGGYDCMTAGVHVEDATGQHLFTLDCGNFGGPAWESQDAVRPVVEAYAAAIIDAVNAAARDVQDTQSQQ